MINKNNLKVLILIIITVVMFLCSCGNRIGKGSAAGEEKFAGEVVLKDDWYIQSSEVCKDQGDSISQLSYEVEGWYKTTVPSTVMAALVKNGVFKDIYFGKNLENIATEVFKKTWWFRKEFNVNLDNLGEEGGSYARIIFEGINYKADIWLNGKQIGFSRDITGSFRMFDMDVTSQLCEGKNVLAVEVIPPKPGDFTIGYVDWNPAPPGNNMGLWREVKLVVTGEVSIDNPFVWSKVKTDTLDEARLTISANLANHSKETVQAEVKGEIRGIGSFSQVFKLAGREKKTVTFTPEKYPVLKVKNPELWWPNNLGEANLYGLKMEVSVDKQISHRQDVTFGIREVSDYVDAQGYRGYKVNGKEVLLLGAAWVDELLLADDDKKIEDQFDYIKHLNLNTIRLEGFWGSSHKLYNMADRHGILLMAGWSCQWEWEEYLGKPVDNFGGVRTAAEIDLVAKMLKDQVVWLRNHPGVLMWVLGSDLLPRPELEKRYRADLAEVDPSRPILSSCKDHTSEISGPSAAKMRGPYDYVTPNYWYVDTQNGGAFGFNTETGPGPQPLPLETLKRMIPADRLWPINDDWNFHCGRREFNTINRYWNAFINRYGTPSGVEEFSFKAQAASYEAMRAMFEAFAVNRPVSKGVIQWMLNSAWPEMYWQLYDYYLMPNGAFYGARNAAKPLQLIHHYGNRSIYVSNLALSPFENLTAHARYFTIDSKEIGDFTYPVSIGAGRSAKITGGIPLKKLTPTYFLDLRLTDSSNKNVARNFYWLSTKEDILDEKGLLWFVTPNKQFADLTGLNRLQPVEILTDEEWKTDPAKGKTTLFVTLENPSKKIAFFIELKVVGDKSGQSVLPVFWDDNYISLLPGETRTVTVSFSNVDLKGEKPVFRYTGWNVKGL